MTAHRLAIIAPGQPQNFTPSGNAKGLAKREAWKYEAIRKRLEAENVAFQFEFNIGKASFDLVLFQSKTIVEFDSPYHKYEPQLSIDKAKDELAKANGFDIVRIQVRSNAVYPASVLDQLSIAA